MQNNSIKIYMTSNVIDIFLWIAYRFEVRVRVMVFNAIFNNISELSSRFKKNIVNHLLSDRLQVHRST
jgi:hypothetical protein